MFKLHHAPFAILAILLSANSAVGQRRPPLSVVAQDFHGVNRVVVATANGKPAGSDLPFNVVVRVHDYRFSNDIISKDAVLARGKSSVVVDIPYLQSRNNWTMYDVIVERDGNRVFNKSTDLITTNFQPNNGWYRGDWTLFVSSNIVSNASRKFTIGNRGKTTFVTTGVGVSDPKLLPSFVKSIDAYQNQGLINQGTIINDLSVLQTQTLPIRSIHPSNFFESWKSLHGFKSVLISFDDFKLVGSSPAKLATLRQWVSVGGNLIVFDVGDEYKGRDQVFQILGFEANKAKWLEPGTGASPVQSLDYQGNVMRIGNASGGEFSEPDLKTTSKLSTQRFVKTSIMEGSLFLIADDMTKWKKRDWAWLQSTLAMSTDVQTTIGSYSNDRYYLQGFSIPGIGKPPVLIFQLLIGLFVLVLGPLSYYLCQTSGRPHMLLVTTPAFAFFSVAALLTYGIFSDGFGLKGRAHSVTRVDHSSDLAFTSTRQVFYSGISPGQCQFDEDVLAIDSRAEFSPPTQTRYREKWQSLSGGQIKARSPFQFSSLQCFETDRQLSLLSGADGFVAANGYQTTVQLAIFKKGNVWLAAKNIAPQGTAAAEALSIKEAHEQIYGLFRKELVENLSIGNKKRNRWNYVADGQQQWGYCSAATAQLDRVDSLREIFENADYVAVVDSTPRLPDPLPAVDYSGNQLHIIIGNW